MEDKFAADLIRSQAKKKDSDLDFKDTSLKKPVTNSNWKAPVGSKIEESDAVIVMVGPETHESKAVEWEIKKAQQNGIPVVPVKVHKNENPKMPKPIKDETAIKRDLGKVQDQINESTDENNNDKTSRA